MSHMHALVIGESLIDVIEGNEHWGGSPMNTAIAIARLGRPTRFATCFGKDERGQQIREQLRSEGVHLASDPLTEATTSTAIATVAPDGSATYDIDLNWDPHHIDPRVLDNTAVLHIGSIAALIEPGCQLVENTAEALVGKAWISYDLNLRPSVTGTGIEIVNKIEHLTSLSTLVKASDQDLKAIYPNQSIEDSAQHLLRLGPKAVVVTRGPKGSTWYGQRFTVPIAAPAVEVVDSIAAGDTFSAALIDALWDMHIFEAPRPLTLPEIEGVLAHATKAANVTVTREGADPPRRSELYA